MARRRWRLLKAIGILLVLLIVAGTLLRLVFGVRPFQIPGESMTPTLGFRDRLIQVDTSSPERGDIVTFDGPADPSSCPAEPPARAACDAPARERGELEFVQRVVAVGGDRVSIRGGRLHLNGEQQDEPWVPRAVRCETCDLPREMTVPDGHVFLMGDNRRLRADSRTFGPVPADWVNGKAVLRYWPLDELGTP
jgi:signal peptidase I